MLTLGTQSTVLYVTHVHTCISMHRGNPSSSILWHTFSKQPTTVLCTQYTVRCTSIWCSHGMTPGSHGCYCANTNIAGLTLNKTGTFPNIVYLHTYVSQQSQHIVWSKTLQKSVSRNSTCGFDGPYWAKCYTHCGQQGLQHTCTVDNTLLLLLLLPTVRKSDIHAVKCTTCLVTQTCHIHTTHKLAIFSWQ